MPNEAKVDPANDQLALREQQTSALAQANALEIKDANSLQTAAQLRTGISTLKKNIAEWFTPKKRAMDAAKQTLLDAERDLILPLDQARSRIDSKVLAWNSIQDMKRRQAEAEANAKAEEEARKQREKLEAQAAKNEAKGKIELAEAQRESAAAVVAAPLPVNLPPAPKMVGAAIRKTWDFEVTSIEDLILAIADQIKAARSINQPCDKVGFLETNDQTIRKYITATSGRLTLPGVWVFQRESVMQTRSA